MKFTTYREFARSRQVEGDITVVTGNLPSITFFDYLGTVEGGKPSVRAVFLPNCYEV